MLLQQVSDNATANCWRIMHLFDCRFLRIGCEGSATAASNPARYVRIGGVLLQNVK